ncbi:unnamed protein product [Rotaria socialis]|uniref:Uncharacterized protein n=3 Tax=Rotaria socialis TaxID=392032 RepID=A0A817Y0V5_9BILA|nr:unnamed protein product [Rotaria socialis]CAF3377034.1 unnamed protein product [Rotaria socialis]CAF3617950.1 unnamed protein product [Rotaria socialis]CAF4208142.1 unnamed protein product [Rotaria socialis]CAF4251617.1 unnamed protein product [Rotaria socialis]
MAQVSTIAGSENLKNNYHQNTTMYYLRLNEDRRATSHDQCDLPESSIGEEPNSFLTQPELYHVKAEENNIENSISHASSIPYESLGHQPKPEVYYITLRHENIAEYNRQSPVANNTVNDHRIHPNNSSEGTVTAYMIATVKEDDSESNSLPPIRPRKKKHTVSFNLADKNDKYDRNDFPIGPQDVTTNFRYTPLSQSKASESIRRSMNKYRFGEI